MLAKSVEYKKGSIVKHPNHNLGWGNGIVVKDSDGISVEIRFSSVGLKTLSLHHVKPIHVDKTIEAKAKSFETIGKNRIYVNESFADIFQEIKSKYPNHLVIIKNGYYYEVLERDAEKLSKMYGWKIYERQVGLITTGFPEGAIKIWDDLKGLNIPFIVVSQLPNEVNGKIQRSISEIFL
jgi:hypothetical protein